MGFYGEPTPESTAERRLARQHADALYAFADAADRALRQAQDTAAAEASAREAAYVAALERMAAGSPPDDWNPYGDADGYDYPGYGERGDPDYVDAPDSSNSGDMHGHGRAVGRWDAAKQARAALTAAPERARALAGLPAEMERRASPYAVERDDTIYRNAMWVAAGMLRAELGMEGGHETGD
jgi:hypothetical protein